jgi:predicted DNA-binding transcriptional regulator AlpA
MAKPEVSPLPLLLDEIAAEAFSGISRYALRGLRRERRGPVVVKLGRSVRFRPEDLAAYVAANACAPCDLPPVKRRGAAR